MSERIKINQCLNKELHYYGLKFTGLLTAGLTGLILLTKFEFTFAIIGGAIAYLFGANFSSYWYKGYIQKWCYGNLPTQLISMSRYLPNSCIHKFL